MEYDIRPIKSTPDRLFAFGSDKFKPIGSFKDTGTGTDYIASKCAKGIFEVVGLKSDLVKDRKKLLQFIELIDGQKIPNVPFRVKFTTMNLSEDGFKEFLLIIFPKRKNKKTTTRRYYLHSKLAGWVNLYTTDMVIGVIDFEMSDIPPKIRKYIIELRDKFHYNIQIEIPPAKKIENGEIQTS